MSHTNIDAQKRSEANLTSDKLIDGLTLVGKSLISTLEWTGEFTKVQNQHYEDLKAREMQLEKMISRPSSYKYKILEGLSKFTLKVCRLCFQQKPSESFMFMSACQHPFCFSCLNTYAISKIQDMGRVSCPHPGCISEMKLSSPIYKYLPEKIKLQYLEYLIKSKDTNKNLKEKCLRCLQTQHSGHCKVIYNKQTIENAFEFRKCRKCLTEVHMSQGKRKIFCEKCQHSFCYLCGQDWAYEGNHECKQVLKIKELEKQLDGSNYQSGDYCRCCGFCQSYESFCSQYCPGLNIRCCQNCDQCLSSCCQCDGCDISLIMGNIFCFFLRIMLTLVILGFYVLLMLPMTFLLAMWLVMGISFGLIVYPCQIIGTCEGIWKCLAVLACPLLALPGLIVGPIETVNSFSSVFNDYCELLNMGICSMWISCSPSECCK